MHLIKYQTILLLFIGFSVNSQQLEIEKIISDLNSKIKQSEKKEHLKWMDSLSAVIEFKDVYHYDSIANGTIKLALELDNLEVAGRNTHQLIYYNNNILGKTKEALGVFNGFLDSIERVGDYKTKSLFYMHGAFCYDDMYELEDALKYYNLSKENALKTGNEKLLATLALRMGSVNMEMGVSDEASQLLQEAIRMFSKQKDTLKLIDAKNDISILYSQHAFYKEAEKERGEAIELANTVKGGVPSIALLYFNAAADYRMINVQDKRVANLKLALKNNNSDRREIYHPVILCDLIIALAENDSLEQALTYFKQVENDPDTYSEGMGKEMRIETLKQISFAKKNYENALKYGKEHLSLKKQYQGFVEIMNAEKFLSDVYNKLNDEANSKKHLINHYKIKDSITNVQNTKTLSLYQTRYETEKRDLKIKAQETDIALLDEKNKVKNQWLLFGGLGLLGVFGIVLLWRSRNTARKRQELQEHFSHDLIQAQEEERTRISKDLHDSVGQQLTLIKKKAQNLEQGELSELTNTALEEVRSISRGLFPATLKQLGVSESIEQLLFDLDNETDMFFSVEIDNIDAYLNEDETLNFYRFIQESVSNALKHSQAKTLTVNISKEKDIIKTIIKDNGVGFNNAESLKQNSLGLKTIEERIKILKGTLTLKSKKGQGTTVLAQIPV